MRSPFHSAQRRSFRRVVRLATVLGFVWQFTGCSDDEPLPRDDAAIAADASVRDGSIAEAGSDGGAAERDAATSDAATSDATTVDAATSDAATSDAAASDAAASDAAPSDAASSDAASDFDAAITDASPSESDAEADAALSDAGDDAAVSDAGLGSEDAEAGGEDAGVDGGTDPEPNEDTFSMRVVALGLEAPWEVTWGPDDQLWITERTGLRVTRVDPVSGEPTVALAVADAHQSAGQDGVLGMVLDPRLGLELGADYVYLAYTYDADPGAGLDRRARIARYTYSTLSESLGSPLVLIENLPASNDHNSGRLAYGPDDHLYYTIGDQGKNQFDNKCQVVRAQDLPSQSEIDLSDWSAYQGKILRLGLDGSIPVDNPILASVRSHIYSYGHRNAQGVAFGPDGKLYASEQGPKTDDEINWIQPGKNYGWPQVAGYRDDRAYVYGNWSASTPEPCESLPFSDYVLPPSVPQTHESEWSRPDFSGPLTTFYTVDDDYDFSDPACFPNAYICWPTIAPSGLDVYVAGQEGLQTWGNALLIPSLKEGCVFRVRLNADGTAVAGEVTELFKTTNRYRDLAIAPDKRTFYVVTDDNGLTSGPTSGATQVLEHRGAVLEFTQLPVPGP